MPYAGEAEAWPCFPYGPITKHPNYLEAIRELRTRARREAKAGRPYRGWREE